MRLTQENSVPQLETVQYSGEDLAQLLACSVETTVVMSGSQPATRAAHVAHTAAAASAAHEYPRNLASYEPDGGSFAGPVVFTLTPPAASRSAGPASRLGAALALALIGIAFGALVGNSVSAGAHAVGSGVARHVQKRVRVDETSPLVVVPMQKAVAAARRGRSGRGVSRLSAGQAEASPPTVEVDGSLDALRQAQLDRPF
jgi:hypothetical protein